MYHLKNRKELMGVAALMQKECSALKHKCSAWSWWLPPLWERGFLHNAEQTCSRSLYKELYKALFHVGTESCNALWLIYTEHELIAHLNATCELHRTLLLLVPHVWFSVCFLFFCCFFKWHLSAHNFSPNKYMLYEQHMDHWPLQ